MGSFSVAGYRGVSQSGLILLGNIPLSSERLPIYRKYFTDLPYFFQDSALIDRFHGFIEGWKLPRMRENMKLHGYALNVEYFSEILHSLRTVADFPQVVDDMLIVPKNADTRDVRAIKKLCSAYLKLLFPNVRSAKDIDRSDFETYCLQPAMRMRAIIRQQLHLMDSEYPSELPDIRVRDI